MNLEPRPEDLQAQTTAHELVAGPLADLPARLERDGRLDDAALAALRDSGLLLRFLPATAGGAGHDLLAFTFALEELAKASPALALLAATQVVVAQRALLAFAERPDRDELARAMVTLDGVVALAASEVGAGCDLAAVAAAYRGDGDLLVVGGMKRYVNWAARARWHAALLAREGGGASLLLVPREAPGAAVGETLPTMGMAGLEAASVTWSEVRLDRRHLVGAEGYGFAIHERCLAELRVALAAIATGMAQAAFDVAVAHGKTRKQGGQPVGAYQSLQWRFADMAMAVDAARLHTWNAAVLARGRRPFGKESAMAKVVATEAAQTVADFAVQVHGGEGYLRGATAERLYRDSRFLRICGGTSEVLRNAIAEQL